MLVSAFAGRDFILRAYEEAIRQRYRLYSFGDAMLAIAGNEQVWQYYQEGRCHD